MGLDLAELVMDVEDTFGLTLPEKLEDGHPIRTVGELAEYVRRKLSTAEQTVCFGGFCFYRLRDALVKTVGVERRSLRPSTSWSDLASPERSVALYKAVREALGEWGRALPTHEFVTAPPRKSPLPSWAQHVVMAVALLAGAAGFFAGLGGVLDLLSNGVGFRGLAIGMMLMAASCAAIHYFVDAQGHWFSRKTDDFPGQCRTLGDLARYMSDALRPDDFAGAVPSPAEILSRVKRLVAPYAGVPPERIKDTDDLVHDLGMG